ncbi:6230_t:CDS:2, partial [Gigaspora rosea]
NIVACFFESHRIMERCRDNDYVFTKVSDHQKKPVHPFLSRRQHNLFEIKESAMQVILGDEEIKLLRCEVKVH